MRIKLATLFIWTGVVAVLIACDLHWIAISLFIAVFLPLALLRLIFHLAYRFQWFTADWLTPYLYPRGLFRAIRWICGRKYAAWALNSYAVTLALHENYETAIVASSRVLELDNTWPAYWINRGAARSRNGQMEEAIDDFTRALTLDKDHQDARMFRGFAYLQNGNLPAALRDLESIDCDSSNHYEIAHYRGHIHEQLHNWEEAKNDYLLAHELDATQTGAGISLARLQAGCPDATIRDGYKALENAKNMCVRTNWRDWIAVSVLAAAYSETGDFESALKYANDALELAPENEKPERRQRIAQFQQGLPFRLPALDPASGLPLTQDENGNENSKR